jgi:hypothetical protein
LRQVPFGGSHKNMSYFKKCIWLYNIRNKSKFYCRSNSEFLNLKKNSLVKVNLYQFEGINLQWLHEYRNQKSYRNKRSWT